MRRRVSSRDSRRRYQGLRIATVVPRRVRRPGCTQSARGLRDPVVVPRRTGDRIRETTGRIYAVVPQARSRVESLVIADEGVVDGACGKTNLASWIPD